MEKKYIKNATEKKVVRMKFEYKFIKIGLYLSKEKLKKKIEKRLLARFNNGMVNEVRKLHKKGLSWKRMEELGLEYKYMALYLQNKIDKKEMIEKLNNEIWHFAKRQKTWFKKDKNTIWINPLEIHEQAVALKKIKDFLK